MYNHTDLITSFKKNSIPKLSKIVDIISLLSYNNKVDIFLLGGITMETVTTLSEIDTSRKNLKIAICKNLFQNRDQRISAFLAPSDRKITWRSKKRFLKQEGTRCYKNLNELIRIFSCFTVINESTIKYGPREYSKKASDGFKNGITIHLSTLTDFLSENNIKSKEVEKDFEEYEKILQSLI